MVEYLIKMWKDYYEMEFADLQSKLRQLICHGLD